MIDQYKILHPTRLARFNNIPFEIDASQTTFVQIDYLRILQERDGSEKVSFLGAKRGSSHLQTVKEKLTPSVSRGEGSFAFSSLSMVKLSCIFVTIYLAFT